MGESDLKRLNDTVEYVETDNEDGDKAVPTPPIKKARKELNKTDVGAQTAGKKQGLNKLDITERAIQRIQSSIAARGTPVKEEVLKVVRRTLLEYCFRGGLMDISLINVQSVKPIQLKTLQGFGV